MNVRSAAVTLIGPGGAGKSTVGALIGPRLGIPFVDLDQCFRTRSGDIGAYIDRVGYHCYARENVETYESLLHDGSGPFVAALSSGFMTYPADIHPGYARLRHRIEESPTTFVLIPSRDSETCVAETVRRQLARPFSRSAAQEEQVIHGRFGIYRNVGARQFETNRPIDAIVDDVCAQLSRGRSATAAVRRPAAQSEP